MKRERESREEAEVLRICLSRAVWNYVLNNSQRGIAFMWSGGEELWEGDGKLGLWFQC